MPRLYAFKPASNRGDWSVNFQIVTDSGPANWDPTDDTVILAMAYDWQLAGTDYGQRSYAYSPPESPVPALVASSADGSGQVTLISPGMVAVLIPAAAMQRFPPVEIIVTLKYQRTSDNRQVTLWQGRLPIMEGFV